MTASCGRVQDFAPRIGISYSPAPKWVVEWGRACSLAGHRQCAIRYGAEHRRAHAWSMPTREQPISSGTPLSLPSAEPSPDYLSFRLCGCAPTARLHVEYLMNVQRQLQQLGGEAGYLGSLSRHLYGFLDANQPIQDDIPRIADALRAARRLRQPVAAIRRHRLVSGGPAAITTPAA